MLKIFFILIASFILTSCEQKAELREYNEIITATQAVSQNDDFLKNHPSMALPGGELPPAIMDLKLSWNTPQGWIEKKSEGIRIATFVSQDDPAIECSIVSLGGMAGGVEANVERWMKQINVQTNDLPEFLNKQLKLKSQGGFEVSIVDLSQLQKNDGDDSPSMIAALVNASDKTIFIKMTGTKKAVTTNFEKFKALCASLK